MGGDAVLGGGVPNLFGNSHPAVGSVGDAALVQGEAHHHAAVLFHQGEYRLHALRLAAHRVEHGLAVVAAHGPLHGNGVGGVQLEGQGDDRLDGAHRLGEEGGLVDFRQTHVYVQDMGARLLLGKALVEEIFNVMLPQRLLEPLLAGGVDTLTDEHRVPADLYRPGVGGHHRAFLLHRRYEGQAPAAGGQGLDVVGGGAAAAAHQMDAVGGQGLHNGCKLLRPHVEHRPASLGAGQTGVGVDHDGQGGTGGQLLHDGLHLSRAHAAVDAQGIHPKTFQQGHGGGHGAAGEQLAVLSVDRGDDHRQVAVLLGGQHGGLGLVAVAHGFDDHQVGPGGSADTHHLGVEGHRVLKIQLSHGLEQLARGPQVQGDVCVGFPAHFGSGGAGDLHTGLHDGLQVKLSACREL